MPNSRASLVFPPSDRARWRSYASLCRREQFLAAPIGRALPFSAKALMIDSIRFAIGESTTVKVRLSLTNSMRMAHPDSSPTRCAEGRPGCAPAGPCCAHLLPCR